MLNDKTVLVVDGNESMRSVLANALKSIGVGEVLLSADGYAALKTLGSQQIDAVICELHVPQLNGWQILEKIRSNPDLADIPLMVVTSDSDRNTVSAALAAGVSDYLIKPFTKDSFIKKAEMLLREVSVGTAGVASLDQEIRDVLASHSRKEKAKQLPNTGRATILIVDDVPSNIHVIGGALKDQYEVSASISGARALEITRKEQKPELILLDIMMPEMDGFEVCRRLKEDPLTADIPVIFVTTIDEVADVVKGFDLGAVDYVTKPIEPEVLKARVRTHISLARARRELQQQIDAMIDNARLRDHVDRMGQNDLKNPLNAIISHANSILESGKDNIDARDMEFIQTSAMDAMNTINTSLDAYKIETGEYQLNPVAVDMKLVTRRAMVSLRSMCEDQKIHIKLREFAKDLIAKGEYMLCVSIVLNLLKNAIQNSEEGQEVTIALEKAEGAIVLRFYNMGIIPLNLRHHLFEKNVGEDKEGGRGLGVYSA